MKNRDVFHRQTSKLQRLIASKSARRHQNEPDLFRICNRTISKKKQDMAHHAYARYYLKALSGPADRTVPEESQFTRLILRSTHMTDNDLSALCSALTTSFETNGAFNCSLALLEEIDLSENPNLSELGLTHFFDTLSSISSGEHRSVPVHRSSGGLHLQTVSALALNSLVESQRQQSSGPSPGDACNSLWRIDASQSGAQSMGRTTRSLATAVVRFLRISRALFDIRLPMCSPDEADLSAEGVACIPGSSMKQNLNASQDLLGALRPTLHPLDDRADFEASDVQLNAEINRYPHLVKERVLAAMIRHLPDPLALMNASKMDLSEPPTADDIQRKHPKVYSVESARFLAHVLSHTSLVTVVDLSNNNVGDDATKELSQFLKANSSVIDLRLRSNNILTDGGLALTEALAGNTTLVELDLSDNSCSDVAVEAFKELVVSNLSRVGFINWTNNCVTSTLVADVNYHLMLNTQPKLVRDAIVRLTKKDPNFTRVLWNTAEPAIGDNTVKALMQCIRGNQHVTHIDVSNSKITDEGARYLAEIVVHCPNLKSLVAQFNNIGDEGALVILHALPQARYIERVDLKHQQPKGISTKILTSLEQLSSLSSQPYVIRTNGLSLVVNDPACTDIDLSVYDGERRVDDSTVRTLSNLMSSNTMVRSLNLRGNRFRVTGSSIPVIASFAHHLTALDLSGLSLKDDDIVVPLGKQFLGKKSCPALQSLNLADNDLTRAASYEFALIARNANDNIHMINFEGNAAISNQDRDVVEFYCGINRYTKTFKEIVLDVEANEKPQLTTLNFTVVERVSQSGTSHRFSKDFDDHAVRLICIALAQNNTVHKVIFSGNKCTDVGATYWAQLLRVNVCIQHLDISYNSIGDEGLLEIVESLELSSSIKFLGFEGNPGSSNATVSKRILAAIRRGNLQNSSDHTVSYASAHSISDTNRAKALRMSLAQAAELDRRLEDAIMAEAMAGYPAKKEKQTYRKQLELVAASQLTKQKDASDILAPLTTGTYQSGIACVPSYLIRDSGNKMHAESEKQ